jgi:hypothetical protein
VPFVIVIQGSVVVAVQEHELPVTTLADWRLNVDGTENAVFVIEYEHCAEAGEASTIQNSATNAQQRGMVMCPPGRIAGASQGPGFSRCTLRAAGRLRATV